MLTYVFNTIGTYGCGSSVLFRYQYVVSATFFVFFFFQAEDGIRDLVRSRGLGDVYKRQPSYITCNFNSAFIFIFGLNSLFSFSALFLFFSSPVSYTHLTLPTSDLV